MKEPILEPILRNMRLAKVLPTIKQYQDCSLLDIGCGWEAKLLYAVEPYIKNGVGIDFKAPPIPRERERVNYKLFRSHSIRLFHSQMRALMW
jgi:cyclopropane fatty-acyl-phospholipid synthase-like methyltransferase